MTSMTEDERKLEKAVDAIVDRMDVDAVEDAAADLSITVPHLLRAVVAEVKARLLID